MPFDTEAIHNEVAPPIAGWPCHRVSCHIPFAPTPLQHLHRYSGMIRPLHAHRYFPPFVVNTYRVFSWHHMKGSHVPQKSPDQARANCTPDAAQPVSRFLLSQSWSRTWTPVLTSSVELFRRLRCFAYSSPSWTT